VDMKRVNVVVQEEILVLTVITMLGGRKVIKFLKKKKELKKYFSGWKSHAQI
jgi:hypothetical protein